MNNRDAEYIDNRLSTATATVSEAYGRLKQIGYNEEAAELMEAMKEFNDKCREVRNKTWKHYRSYIR